MQMWEQDCTQKHTHTEDPRCYTRALGFPISFLCKHKDNTVMLVMHLYSNPSQRWVTASKGSSGIQAIIRKRTEEKWGLEWPLKQLTLASIFSTEAVHTQTDSLFRPWEVWSWGHSWDHRRLTPFTQRGNEDRSLLSHSSLAKSFLPPHRTIISKYEQTAFQLQSLHKTPNNVMGGSVKQDPLRYSRVLIQ